MTLFFQGLGNLSPFLSFSDNMVIQKLFITFSFYFLYLQERINVPSWCDRILWHSFPGTFIENNAYGMFFFTSMLQQCGKSLHFSVVVARPILHESSKICDAWKFLFLSVFVCLLSDFLTN
jgi:hypothetical protein